MKSNSTLELILLAAIWGSSFLFIRMSSAEFGPVLLMATRTLIASVFLVPLMFLYKQQKTLHLTNKGNYGKIFFASMFNTAIPFVLIGYAALTLPAGVTSIINATTPMFAAIIAFFWLKNKMSLSSLFGLLLGFIGVYLLMLDKMHFDKSTSILPMLAGLGASCCYSIGTNYTKQYLHAIAPIALSASNQVAASLVLIPLSLLFLPNQVPSTQAIYAVILLGILCTGIGYILFFNILAKTGAATAVSVTYLIPAFGLFWGAMFLDETITVWILLSSGLILCGIGLTTGLFQRLLSSSFK